jgi:hypothetical protein
VLATLSRWRSSVQIRSGTLATWSCVGWALASLSGRNPPAFGLCRSGTDPAERTGWSPARRTFRRGAMLVFAANLSSSPARVRFPSASMDLARCDGGAYSQALNLADAGSIPARVTESIAKWWNGRHTTFRTSRLHGHGNSSLPLVTDIVTDIAGGPAPSRAS